MTGRTEWRLSEIRRRTANKHRQRERRSISCLSACCLLLLAGICALNMSLYTAGIADVNAGYSAVLLQEGMCTYIVVGTAAFVSGAAAVILCTRLRKAGKKSANIVNKKGGNNVKKRLLSLLLIVCMAVTMLPLDALAAEKAQAEELDRQLALYMSEIGLVGDDGQLIYENSFTLEDGTKLANLDELLDWLLECGDDEMDTLITVDATGKTATADWMIRAISIETDMQILTAQMNALASGQRALTASSGVDTSIHDLHLVQKISVSESDSDLLIIRIGLSDTAGGDFIKAPHQVNIAYGLFANFFDDYIHNYHYLDIGFSTDVLHPDSTFPVNTFSETYLSEGAEYIQRYIDLSKVRPMMPKTLDENWRGHQGHLSGYENLLLQSHVISGAPEQSAKWRWYILRI